MTIKANFPSIRPSLNLDFANSKVLDPRISFSRASTATYYDGKTTVKAEENLVAQSENIGGAGWYTSDATITSNTSVAPNGTSTADTVTATNGASYVGFTVSGATSTTYTYSFFIKNIDSTKSRLLVRNTTTTSDNYINWTGATLTGITNNFGSSATFTDVGNGWYRIVVSYTSVEATQLCRVLPDVVGNKSVYLWGAQLEQRSSATAYTPTTSAPITNYIPALQTAAANVARFDHDPVTGESKGLLVEEQRTNLLTYSEQFDNAAWNKPANTQLIANNVIAPDGTLSGDRILAISNGANSAKQFPSVSGDATYTFSVFIKASSSQWSFFTLYDNTSNVRRVWFNVNTGVVGSSTVGGTFALVGSSIASVGNGWYRCSVTATTPVGISNCYFGVESASADAVVSDVTNGSIYIWGAQLEAGIFPTSYIPTTTAQVTRSADSASMIGTNFSSWYRADEGTLYGEYLTIGTSSGWLLTLDGGASNYLGIAKANSGSTNRLTTVYSGVNQGNIDIGSVANNTIYKLSGAYALNNNAFSVNGSAVSTDTTVTIPNGINKALIGSAFSQSINGTIKRLAYYPARLTNAQLQSLTA